MTTDVDLRETGAPGAELPLNPSRERECRVHSGGLQLRAGQLEQRHRLNDRRDPGGVAVVGRGVNSESSMDDRGELIGGFGKHLYGNFFGVRIEPGVSTLCSEAGELGQLLRPAQRVDIPVENLVGGGPCGTLPADLNRIRIFRRRRAVLLLQTGHGLGTIGTAMAGVASYR